MVGREGLSLQPHFVKEIFEQLILNIIHFFQNSLFELLNFYKNHCHFKIKLNIYGSSFWNNLLENYST
jgi:hypothetical protein